MDRRISTEEVEYVGALARLELSEDEKKAFTQQLGSILTYMDQLNRVDTQGVDQTATVVRQSNVFREDVPRPSLPPDSAMANAPEAREGFFGVPKIITDR